MEKSESNVQVSNIVKQAFIAKLQIIDGIVTIIKYKHIYLQNHFNKS